MSATTVEVRGGASAEELAAVLALVAQVERAVEPDRYADWRRGRLDALRRAPDGARDGARGAARDGARGCCP